MKECMKERIHRKYSERYFPFEFICYYIEHNAMTVHIKRMVIDSLKPRETTILDLSKALCEVKGVDEVDITVTEVDVKTETIKLTVRGSDIAHEELTKVMSEHGATIRSLDEINVSRAKVTAQPK